MKVLILTWFYPPECSYGQGVRPYAWAKALVGRGHRVLVLAGREPNGDPSLPGLGEVEVKRLSPPVPRHKAPPGVNPLAKRLARWLVWPDSRVSLVLKLRAVKQMISRWRPDLALVCVPPYTNLLLAPRLGVPYVLDIWDPWVPDLYGVLASPLHRALALWAERRAIAASLGVITVNRPLENLYRERGAKKTLVLPFGHWEPQIGAMPRWPLRVLYVGSLFGEHKNPKWLARELRGIGEAFTLVGLKDPRYLRDLEAAGARLLGPLPHRKAVEMARGFQALLVYAYPGRGYHLVSTAKATEILGYGRAILALVPGDTWIAELLLEAGAYLADARRPGALRETFFKMKEDLGAGRLRVPSLETQAKFSWERLGGELVDFLEEIQNGPGRPPGPSRGAEHLL